MTFSVDSENCNLSSSTLTSCTVPVEVLRAEPFGLDWGADVYAKVTAKNVYGDSVESEEGNGAKIIT